MEAPVHSTAPDSDGDSASFDKPIISWHKQVSFDSAASTTGSTPSSLPVTASPPASTSPTPVISSRKTSGSTFVAVLEPLPSVRGWTCPACTLWNQGTGTVCAACEMPTPEESGSQQDDSISELQATLGASFLAYSGVPRGWQPQGEIGGKSSSSSSSYHMSVTESREALRQALRKMAVAQGEGESLAVVPSPLRAAEEPGLSAGVWEVLEGWTASLAWALSELLCPDLDKAAKPADAAAEQARSRASQTRTWEDAYATRYLECEALSVRGPLCSRPLRESNPTFLSAVLATLALLHSNLTVGL